MRFVQCRASFAKLVSLVKPGLYYENGGNENQYLERDVLEQSKRYCRYLRVALSFVVGGARSVSRPFILFAQRSHVRKDVRPVL